MIAQLTKCERQLALAVLLALSICGGLTRLRTLADELTDESAAVIVPIWRSQRAILVTRQDTHVPNFQESCEQMAAVGWPVVVLKSGGGACPISPGTVQIATIEPAVLGATMSAKYEALTKLIQSALQFYGVVARTGAVAGAYCPGGYDPVGGGQEDRGHGSALVPQS
jgi:lipoate-protein ligase A